MAGTAALDMHQQQHVTVVSNVVLSTATAVCLRAACSCLSSGALAADDCMSELQACYAEAAEVCSWYRVKAVLQSYGCTSTAVDLASAGPAVMPAK
eukprot:COSAG01_NODE_3885_length_5566_cov_10.185529_4_plen_96_part_00